MMGAFCDITKGNHVSLADITITGAKPSFNSPVCTTFAPVVIRMYNISRSIGDLIEPGPTCAYDDIHDKWMYSCYNTKGNFA